MWLLISDFTVDLLSIGIILGHRDHQDLYNEHDILSTLPLLWYKSKSNNNQVRRLTLWKCFTNNKQRLKFSDLWHNTFRI